MSLQSGMRAFGFRLVRQNSLRKPRLERERFSGGWNDSARRRNAEALNGARHVYRIGDEIHVPAWYWNEFIRDLDIALSTSEELRERRGSAMTIEVREGGRAYEAPWWDTEELLKFEER